MREVFCGRGVAARTKGLSCGTDFASRCYFGTYKFSGQSNPVRFFLPEATTEIQEVKNMSQLKKIQSSLLEMKSIYALAAIAMLLALRIVLGFLQTAHFRFSETM